MPPQEQGITMSQLKEILAAQAEANREAMEALAVSLRKPLDPTPEEAARIESDKQMRKETAQLQIQIQENKRAEQNACLHLRRDGTTSCVFVYPQQGRTDGYMICQQCQGRIRPEPRPVNDQETWGDIYNTRLFNEHFIKSQSAATFA